VSFAYFAYGSNLWLPQIRSRCPSAQVIGPATLADWALICDKPSADGSSKFNIRPQPGGTVDGLVYDIEDAERESLDAAEPGYTPVHVELEVGWTLAYTYEGEPHRGAAHDWYVATARAGAVAHGLPTAALGVETAPDPLAPGIRPAATDDRVVVQEILSAGLAADTTRYFIHPGDYGWWVYHDDPRHPDHFSTWLQGDAGFVTIDSLEPNEINVFTRPGVDRIPLIRWAQRRLGGRGEVGWISDDDVEMVDGLRAEGYSPVFAYRSYRWVLDEALPEPDLPSGWVLRPVAGEGEADMRRRASHAAFDSRMEATTHLQRYIDFMRSPVYVPERDLVAVAPDGTIASFMVWWGDDASGVAQIEPFGTHPDFHRRGIGRALLYHGLAEMRRAGMRVARVCTDDDRPATGFYEGVGFRDVGRLRWWAQTA
jgi:ribosomal protein S18 acetylase RimI-like enzyme